MVERDRNQEVRRRVDKRRRHDDWCNFADRHHAEGLLPILQQRHQTDGKATPEAVQETAVDLGIPPSQAQSVSTFYSMLRSPPESRTFRVCDGIVCWLHGADHCAEKLQKSISHEDQWEVERCSCLGLCEQAPAAIHDGRQIGHLRLIDSCTKLAAATPTPHQLGHLHDGECRVLLERVGRNDPDSIEEAMSAGVYDGLSRARAMSPDDVIREVESTRLTGRGGAGFPTATKWRMAAQMEGTRYLVCNADESEPLMFKDRVLLESDPHSVLEGMAIAAHAIGASEGIIYIRGEYEPQAERLERAIERAVHAGVLSDAGAPGLHVTVHRGAGAYICGEESALLDSLEGRRGEPRVRPPFPVTSGFRGQPTVVNNVETLATVAAILRMGADAYLRVGDPERPGSRLCTLLGHVNTPGLVEVPYGLTLHQLLEHFAGGLRPHSQFHFALVGGAAGTFVAETHLERRLATHTTEAEIAMGSGGVFVCDESVSVPAVLHQLLRFFERESCGKCTPCRIGTSECATIVDRLLQGEGSHADLDRLAAHSELLRSASFCGLGTSAALPIQSALKHFWSEFEELIP